MISATHDVVLILGNLNPSNHQHPSHPYHVRSNTNWDITVAVAVAVAVALACGELYEHLIIPVYGTKSKPCVYSPD